MYGAPVLGMLRHEMVEEIEREHGTDSDASLV
jgi:hypothetical protein